MSKQKNKKKNNGYFAKNVQQNGNNFLMRKTAKDIKYDSRNIFRDIAFSNAEYDIPGIVEFFTNLTFITNLSSSAFEEMSRLNATFIGLQTYIINATNTGLPIDPNARLNEFLLETQQKLSAYQIIVRHLNNMLGLFSICADDDWLKANIEIELKSLCMQLGKYKRMI